jgi:hypothetical protein
LPFLGLDDVVHLRSSWAACSSHNAATLLAAEEALSDRVWRLAAGDQVECGRLLDFIRGRPALLAVFKGV